MHTRLILAGLLLTGTAPAGALPPATSFEQKVVAIMSAGGSADLIQSRLDRVGSTQPLTSDQQVAIEALGTLVRGKVKPNGLSVAEAEAFAARHPGSPASAFLVAEAALANNEPQRSADTLIAAAVHAGSLIQLISPTAVSKLADELDALSDRDRTAALAKALLYGHWARGSPSLRSFLALAAIRDELAAGRLDRARALLVVIESPATFHEVLIDERLAPLRVDIERIAGLHLEHAWQDYLDGAGTDWVSRGDVISAAAYVEALKQANQYEALADAFLPRFLKGYNCPSDLVARTIGADLADSLARAGRWAKSDDIIRRSGGVSPAIYAATLLERGNFGQAEALLSRSLKAAGLPKSKTDEKALAWLRAADSCAAFRGGRPATVTYDPALLDVSPRLFVLLCLDRAPEAQAALIAALSSEDERADALRWVQPFKDQPVQSKFREEMNAKIRALQQEPSVTEAVSRYGRILDWPFTSGAPENSDTAVLRSTNAWQCGQQSDWQAEMPKVESIRLPDSQP